jgi:hypothetical protein
MSAFAIFRACRRAACGAVVALELGLRLWAQAPAGAAGGGTNAGWQLTAEVDQGYDSDAMLSLARPQGDATTQLRLGVGRVWSGPTWSFSATYTPQAEAYARNVKLDYIAQSYGQTLEFATSANTRWTWGASAERFPERGGAGLFGGGGLSGVSSASQALALATVLTGASTTFGVSHRSSLRSTWSASLSGGADWFAEDQALLGSGGGAPAAAGSNSRTAGANLGWSYVLGPQWSWSMSGSESLMQFSGNAQSVRYSALQTGVQREFGSQVTLALSAGPSWSQTRGGGGASAVAHLPALGYAANASLTVGQGQGQYGITWSHSLQMGLVPGGLATDVLALNYGLHGRGGAWSASASLGESRLAGSFGPGMQDSLFASSQLSLRLASAWSLTANGEFIGQNLPGVAGQFRREVITLGLLFAPGGAR